MNRYGHQLFRMRKTFHSHPDARGVGLFISKNQVEAMGGEIRAHGKEGVGMTFIVKFKKDL
jgi:signal transduction histidine kinase